MLDVAANLGGTILATVLAPLDLDVFWKTHWDRRAVAVVNRQHDRFATLFSWSALNHILNFHTLRIPEDLRLTGAGRSPSVWQPREGLAQLQEGATLVLNRLHERDPAIATFAAALRDDLGHRIQVNAYATPPTQQGFDCHYDTHDVLVLQLDGDKEWFVFEPSTIAPTATTRSPDDLPPDSPPYLNVTLAPGDVLYIPRGHWHYALAGGDRPSLHLTVGIDCETGLDWLAWLGTVLAAEPDWRRNLPPVQSGDPTALVAAVQNLGDRLAAQLQDPAPRTHLAQAYAAALAHGATPVAPCQLPQQLGHDCFPQGAETQWAWTAYPRLRLQPQPDGSTAIQFGATQIAIAGLDPAAVAVWLERSPFTLWDLADLFPDLDWESELTPLLMHLIQAGVLQVLSRASTE
jgi:ribosomal protein L16 Arg81 hydroxylase